jgi:hypothetical protein
MKHTGDTTMKLLKPLAALIAFFDWLGQQDETLKYCYVKRCKLWGVL